MLASCWFCSRTYSPNFVISVINLLITNYPQSNNYNSHSIRSMADSLQISNALCCLQDNLPEDMPSIHSKPKQKLISQLHTNPIRNYNHSVPSAQRSVDVDRSRQITLWTFAQNEGSRLKAKKNFSSNTLEQRSKIGYEKWRKMNQTVSVKNGRTHNGQNDKNKASLFTEEEISQNWLEELSAEPGIYTLLCKPTSKEVTPSPNWYSQFMGSKSKQNIHEKKQRSIEETDETEDSIEFIDPSEPGPAHYRQSHPVHTASSNAGTFGGDERFRRRPVTADVQINLRKDLMKKKVSNELKNVRFGTSLKNLKSEIKKVNYCDWNRSHCCNEVQGMADQQHTKLVNYSRPSNQRFPDPKKIYNGPDYYYKLNIYNKKKSNLPAHYFISDVEKGLPTIEQEDSLPEVQQHEPNEKGLRPNLRALNSKKQEFFPRQAKQYGIHDLLKQISNQIPKNTLGAKKRKALKPPTRVHEKPACEIEVEDNENRRVRPKGNEWIKKSFNIKFQTTQKND